MVCVDCSGFLPMSTGDVMTSTPASCTSGPAPADELCQQPGRLSNAAAVNSASQVS